MMYTATATKLETKKPKQVIPAETLLEELYTNYSLNQLQQMLAGQPDKMLLQKWNITDSKLRADLALAIEFVKND